MRKKKNRRRTRRNYRNTKRRRRRLKKSVLIALILIILALVSFGGYKIVNKINVKTPKKEIIDYASFFDKHVVITKDAKLYLINEDKYEEAGIIYKDTLVTLTDQVDKDNNYFQINDLKKKYYLKYGDFKVTDSTYKNDQRYLKYIPFNNNVVTNDQVTIYLDENKLYTLKESLDLPIIIKKKDRYYVEYNDMLVYIIKDDVKEITNHKNSDKANTKGVPVLNYHFVYYPDQERCNQEICHTVTQFRTHMSYIRDNGYFTPTMKELEMYIDGEVQLPSSVVITIDDGRNVNLASEILEEYKLNATAFIVTGRFNMERDFKRSPYVEFHSHSHNLHNAGSCPPGHGQGGGLTCFKDEDILKDLKTSRELLDGATAFCYPFYEYNSHAIELLKQAGFTMGFAGEYTGGKTKAVVGIDKFRIPRWVIVNYTTMNDFTSYVSGRA